MDLKLSAGDATFSVRVHLEEVFVQQGDESRTYAVKRYPDGSIILTAGEKALLGYAVKEGDTLWARVGGRTYRFDIERGRRGGKRGGGGSLASPMPGQVQKILVQAGDAVEAGQALAVVEAMKMQLEIKAPHAGTVKELLAAEGDQVAAGVPLVALEAAE